MNHSGLYSPSGSQAPSSPGGEEPPAGEINPINHPKEWAAMISRVAFPATEGWEVTESVVSAPAPDFGLSDLVTVSHPTTGPVLFLVTGSDLFVPPLRVEDDAVWKRRQECMQAEWRRTAWRGQYIHGGVLVGGEMVFWCYQGHGISAHMINDDVVGSSWKLSEHEGKLQVAKILCNVRVVSGMDVNPDLGERILATVGLDIDWPELGWEFWSD
ncbi:uncharacterized protein BO97DRAFT_283194 [Aspergillus homomorphus CBS 101889]|uniref:Uncharacterized protein n=1 Tax=Aspergillus homomorphus (strain CBS 101889) TaxID=1450537 RepID=A0A395I3M0_ASPHC|nr:hypothetical protein BO97DRAFT_283194 [Aspergillus homomorphus CBS 101889]RAL14335.1 hypothetical protein BO97DRAFT_283194 [Aspergillus homomorphus CBS 101889]